MPVYTYRCPKCFYTAEIEAVYSQYPMLKPPICGDGNVMMRIYKANPVKYIGKGFATNDLRKKDDNNV